MENIYTNNLTRKNEDGTYRVPINQRNLIVEIKDKFFSCYKGKLVERLAAYEEIGLEPNEVAELKAIKNNLEYKVKQLEEQIKWNRNF